MQNRGEANWTGRQSERKTEGIIVAEPTRQGIDDVMEHQQQVYRKK